MPVRLDTHLTVAATRSSSHSIASLPPLPPLLVAVGFHQIMSVCVCELGSKPKTFLLVLIGIPPTSPGPKRRNGHKWYDAREAEEFREKKLPCPPVTKCNRIPVQTRTWPGKHYPSCFPTAAEGMRKARASVPQFPTDSSLQCAHRPPLSLHRRVGYIPRPAVLYACPVAALNTPP